MKTNEKCDSQNCTCVRTGAANRPDLTDRTARQAKLADGVPRTKTKPGWHWAQHSPFHLQAARCRRRCRQIAWQRTPPGACLSQMTPKECWAVSAPRENRQHARRQPGSGAARRYPVIRPLTALTNADAPVISFTGGYPFAPDSTVGPDRGRHRIPAFREWRMGRGRALKREDARIL